MKKKSPLSRTPKKCGVDAPFTLTAAKGGTVRNCPPAGTMSRWWCDIRFWAECLPILLGVKFVAQLAQIPIGRNIVCNGKKPVHCCGGLGVLVWMRVVKHVLFLRRGKWSSQKHRSVVLLFAEGRIVKHTPLYRFPCIDSERKKTTFILK